MWSLTKAMLVGGDKKPYSTTNPLFVTSGGTWPLVTGQQTRPADATAYTIGDHIANSLTGGLVLPITFAVTPRAGGTGRLVGGRCVLTAASGTVVIPKFDLLLFRPAANIPFAAAGYPADNAALNVSAAAMKELVGVLPFSDTAWRNQLGGATAAGDHLVQEAAFTPRSYAPFSLASLSATTLLGILQVQNAWNPGAVVNTFDFNLGLDVD